MADDHQQAYEAAEQALLTSAQALAQLDPVTSEVRERAAETDWWCLECEGKATAAVIAARLAVDAAAPVLIDEGTRRAAARFAQSRWLRLQPSDTFVLLLPADTTPDTFGQIADVVKREFAGLRCILIAGADGAVRVPSGAEWAAPIPAVGEVPE